MRSMTDLPLHPRQTPTFYFIGVTTRKSSIMGIFPRWMAALGRPEVVIEGIDFPLHDDPARYRQMVAFIKGDPLSLGGLVTTHKLDLLAASRDLFDALDPYAQITHEISSISKRGGRLIGHAKDPISSGRTLMAMLSPDHFARTGAEVLCLGAGGAGADIALHLMGAADRPKRMVVTDRSSARLDELRAMAAAQKTDIAFDMHQVSGADDGDRLLAAMPPHSLVINATGMGKDIPGSPLTNAAVFPPQAVVWELNYRGDLKFLHQARAQQTERGLRVEDGWEYFLYGWTQVVAEVLDTPIEGALYDTLARIAADARGA
jgi:shikimate 5-dehydrogenase